MENMVEDIKQHQRNRLEHVERMSPEFFPWKANFCEPTERCDMDQGKD
jgi:hypothetical protein